MTLELLRPPFELKRMCFVCLRKGVAAYSKFSPRATVRDATPK